MQQYATPDALADYCWAHLPHKSPASVLDPQCFEGALLWPNGRHSYSSSAKFGIELDNRVTKIGGVNLITANCMKVFEIMDDLYPDLRFVCINCNPPFGKRLKQADGEFIDSTLATWRFAIKRAMFGFFIGSRKTLEELGLHKHKLTYKYETRKASELWRNMRDGFEIGIIWWKQEADIGPTSVSELYAKWTFIEKAIDQERASRPKFNIYLDESGILKTYLSIRNEVKLKLTKQDIEKLAKINGAHPLTLTTEKETRHLMRDFVQQGIYTIQPEAKAAIESALAEVNALACPIMPTTDFEAVAYCDEEEVIVCTQSVVGTQENGHLRLTAGKSYNLTTGSYKFTENFKRNKVHFNEEVMETYTKEHHCVLSGSDRFIEIKDDDGRAARFMDRPRQHIKNEHDERLLWELFHKPVVNTVAETCAAAVKQNHAVLKALEMAAGYKYYETKNGGGQLGYMARVAVKDAALVAAETGTGKSLFAITLLAVKCPRRALIVAPQGTIRSTDNEDEDGDSPGAMDASQWMKELNRFAPFLQVFEIFSLEDYARICSMNGGSIPEGSVCVTYYEAFMSNGAREKAPDTWDDLKLNKWAKSAGLEELPIEPEADKRKWCDQIGKEVNGVRCILQPCLATLIGDQFDCIMLDEAHRACNLQSLTTQMIIRLQPKYRYAMTATPIPNIVTNLFSLMGWLAVPGWYKGEKLNAAFPYAREDVGRFASTFLSTERDLTQEEDNRKKAQKAGERWSGTCTKESPIISSPARLLKILKPTMAFISKSACSDAYIPPRIIDVRVNMGKEQTALYGYYLDRGNIPASNALVRARKQTAWLRGICADPAGFRHGTEKTPKVFSNMNPKIIAILELVCDIMAKGEQAVIINSRIGLSSTIQNKLCECGIKIARVDSTLPADQHSGQSNLFKDRKAQVMLMGIKSAAAYSFDDCDNCIVGSLEFTPGTLTQARGRIDRVGNKRVKNIYCILHKNSLDELMFDLVGTKDDAATICLRGHRVPREYVPLDAQDVLAKAIDHFDLSGGTPESECERAWPKLRDRITKAVNEGWK